ncbi:DUF5125 domain-containing protein [Thermophagus xiamenensis]|uniref:DUF5125 domain-containing protein n=1 Tax=Thermophagus xiamenensis TaxID=385682 RepID=A0A1I1XGK6_9BACT|nr:DUF5125 domain-containing protein [Thermophagus xiamenensis]SFE06301.1 protein of unknown function [Thermophagus xiamenensis]
MKKIIFFFSLLLPVFFFVACDDDEEVTGQPQLVLNSEISQANFGDSISFSATVSDADNVPLSTLKAQLYFGDEMVQETVIRTKTEGDYSGKIFVPFLKDVPNGTATLKFILQNIRFAIEEQSMGVDLSRPDYPYLILVTDDGNEYQMDRSELYQYTVTANFPQKVNGYIKTPVLNEQGNVITFGWEDGDIIQGSNSPITFSNYAAGEYAISFNTLTYEAAPFITLEFAGEEMAMIDANNYKVEMELEQNQSIEVTGIPDIEQWWIDPDFFVANEDGSYTFLPVSGKYRVIANFELSYFIVEAMSGDETATLQDDGSGALWIIGTDIGKPSLENEVGWNTDRALCMAQITPKKYQVTVVAGQSINPSSINFKFFHQKGWGGEYKNDNLTTSSDIVFVGDGSNGRDPGNLGLVDGVTLTEGAVYVFEVDITAGKENAVLTVKKL